MRLIQLTIPVGKRETILDFLDSEEIDYVVTDETSGREYTAVVSFPLPTPAVEPVLDGLHELDLTDDAHVIVVNAETVISRKFGRLERQYSERDIDESRVSRQELLTEARELTPDLPVYTILTVVSAIVATAGLLLDSPAIVVGSMVIAPLIGPALGASVGTVTKEDELFVEAVQYQVLGIVLSIASAAIFAFVLQTVNIVPPDTEIAQIAEIGERLTPNLLALAVALGAGVAGVLSISTGVSVALVGVMIAAALIPPAAAAGIAIAWGLPMAALGASVLVFVNVLSVNLTGLITLWFSGYRPESIFEMDEAQRRTVRRIVGLAVAVLLLSAFLGGVSYTAYQETLFEEDVNKEVEAVLATDEYEAVVLLSVEIEYEDELAFRQVEDVIVTVGHPPGETYPDLAETLGDPIADRADEEITVQVRFVDTEQI